MVFSAHVQQVFTQVFGGIESDQPVAAVDTGMAAKNLMFKCQKLSSVPSECTFGEALVLWGNSSTSGKLRWVVLTPFYPSKAGLASFLQRPRYLVGLQLSALSFWIRCVYSKDLFLMFL